MNNFGVRAFFPCFKVKLAFGPNLSPPKLGQRSFSRDCFRSGGGDDFCRLAKFSIRYPASKCCDFFPTFDACGNVTLLLVCYFCPKIQVSCILKKVLTFATFWITMT